MSLQVFRNIDRICTFSGVSHKNGRHVSNKDLGCLANGVLVEAGGRILWVGQEEQLTSGLLKELSGGAEINEVDLKASTVMPSFVECHTHLIFAGDRTDEFELRNKGVSYQEIAKRGGGIAKTVGATREASESHLVQLAQERLDRFIQQGVTLCEVKSGYGLSHEQELKMLEVAKQLKGIPIVPTYLGPHSIPKEKSGEAYFEEIIEKTLSEVAKRALAQRVDIFVEAGYFTADQARRYFEKASTLGLAATGHMEQLTNQGGTDAAVEVQALSVDHVVQISQEQILALAASPTVGVLLPGADFYLRMDYPPARKLIDAGACVALATDFNPGSCPTQDISLMGVLARLEMGMSLPEVLSAYTYGAAAALGAEDELGSLEPGKLCDFIVLDGDWEQLFYSVGFHPVKEVFHQGQRITIKK